MFNYDWRITAITNLAENFTSPSWELYNKDNTVIIQSESVNYGDDKLSIHLPNMSALFLNFSNSLFIESRDFFKDSENFDLVDFLEYSETKKYLIPKHDKKLFDNMGNIASSIVFSFTALESLSNEIIPNNYVYTHKKWKRKWISISKDNIEKELSLDIKLWEIIPDILKIHNFKSLEIWREYKELKSKRDMIIHLKDNNKFWDKTDYKIWDILISKDWPNPALISKNIIDFFYIKSNDIRLEWIKKTPF